MAKERSKFTLAQLAGEVARIAPNRLAESWDNVGLQVGDPAASVRRVMTCLEVTAPTLAEAKRRKADAIVAHHPLIFRPMSTLLASDQVQRLVADLVRAQIGLVAAHTNLDRASWGTNEALAELLGWKSIGPLDMAEEPAPLKFVVFTPKGYERKIIDAIARGGGGEIGAYTHCTFRTPGAGTFRGGEGANPFIGQAGALEEAEEYRLEAVVPPSAKQAVLEEVLRAHPYEEPAYEFYVLDAARGPSGLGCIAPLPAPLSTADLARHIKRRLKLKRVRISGPQSKSSRRKSIRKVGICTGSGGSLLGRVAKAEITTYLTGEATYHHGIEAHQRGITMIEIGHFESEQIVAAPLAERLAEAEPLLAAKVKVFAAKNDFQPFTTV